MVQLIQAGVVSEGVRKLAGVEKKRVNEISKVLRRALKKATNG